MQPRTLGALACRQAAPLRSTKRPGDLLSRAGHGQRGAPGVEVVRRIHAQHVAAARPAQRHLKLAHAIHGVSRHPGERHLCRDGAPNHLHRQARLRGKGDLGRHMSCLQASRIVRPGLRQVERAVNEGVPVPGHVGCKHPDLGLATLRLDLAVGHLARRPRVLPPHAARSLALLEEARLVNHQHRVRVGKRLQRIRAHHVAQRVRIPPATAQDGLLPPRAGVARRLGPHPAGLAPLRSQQPIQEQTRRLRHARLGEQRTNAGLGVAQRQRPQLQHRLHRSSRHHQHPPARKTKSDQR